VIIEVQSEGNSRRIKVKNLNGSLKIYREFIFVKAVAVEFSDLGGGNKCMLRTI
jgi:hypothetical protein